MSSKKRALILCHGQMRLKTFKRLPDDIIICADGGAKYAARMGWLPHVIVGDLDSIPSSLRKKWSEAGVDFQVYPAEKDKTDGELALEYAMGLDVCEIVMLGALGGRIDHLLTNVFLLAKFAESGLEGEQGPQVRIIDDRLDVWLAGSYAVIYGQVGHTVSLIPLSAKVKGITTTGLYYPLRNEVLEFGSSRGNSNVMIADVATVKVTGGRLLIVHAWD